jgi:helicase SWR1
VLGERAGLLGDARVMVTVEDTEDRNAASLATKEIVDEEHDDQVDFSEATAARASDAAAVVDDVDAEGNVKERRHVDEYMLGLYREEFGGEKWRPPAEGRKRNRKGVDPHVRRRNRKY